MAVPQGWGPVDHRYPSYSTGAIAIDPTDANVIWLGTGENTSQRSVGWGDGVYKSLNGGRGWTATGLRTSERIGKILVDPRDPDVLYALAAATEAKSGFYDRGRGPHLRPRQHPLQARGQPRDRLRPR